MRVFVAGASGVLGRRTVKLLVARGHEVIGLVRGEDRIPVVAAMGARAVIGDILDPDQIRHIIAGCDAEAVLHLATAIPTRSRTRPADWETNDRLRRQGTRNLVEACRGRPIRAYVQQSVAFVHGDQGGQWLDESAPYQSSPLTQSAIDGEQIALEACRTWALPVVILRRAMCYCPESWHTRFLVRQLRRRQLPVLGDGHIYWHYLHVEDMARAVVAATELARVVIGQVFFVADDEPVEAGQMLGYLAGQMGAPRPLHIPIWFGRLIAGAASVDLLTTSARYRTHKIKRMLGWSPTFPSFRHGFAQILALAAEGHGEFA